MVDFLGGDSGVNAVFLVDLEPKRETEPAPIPLPMGHMEQTVMVLYRSPKLVTRDLVLYNFPNGNFVKHTSTSFK